MERLIYIGMDVHKDTYSLCSFDTTQNFKFSEARVKADTSTVFSCGYEAGPTGFTLCRELQKQGISCVVMAYPYGGKWKYWTQKFFTWLKTLEFTSAIERYSFEEFLAEVFHQMSRIVQLDEKVATVAEQSPIHQEVKKLCCFSD